MLKKLFWIFVFLILLTGQVSGEGDVSLYTGTITTIPDTFYIPPLVSMPFSDDTLYQGIDLEKFTSWGLIFEVTSADTCIADSIWVTLGTDEYDTTSSMNTVYSFSAIVNDSTRNVKMWFAPMDSTKLSAYWFDQYTRATVIIRSPTAVKDTLKANADSTPDQWHASTGTDMYAMIDDATYDSADYIYIAGADSTQVVSFPTYGGAGYVDSVRLVINARYVTAACSINFGVCVTDTASCVWSGATVLTADTGTYTVVATTSPSTDTRWTVAQVDSVLAGFVCDYVAATGSARIFKAIMEVYYSNTEYYDPVKWRATYILKE